MMAIDPRIPTNHQRFEMHVSGVAPGDEVEWIIDGTPNARFKSDKYLWPLVRGHHTAEAQVFHDSVLIAKTEQQKYVVR